MEQTNGVLEITIDTPTVTEGNEIVILHIVGAGVLAEQSRKYHWTVKNSREETFLADPDIRYFSDTEGDFKFRTTLLPPGMYSIHCIYKEGRQVVQGSVTLTVLLNFEATPDPSSVVEGQPIKLSITPGRTRKKLVRDATGSEGAVPVPAKLSMFNYDWSVDNDSVFPVGKPGVTTWTWNTNGLDAGIHTAKVSAANGLGDFVGEQSIDVTVTQRNVMQGDILPVTLRRTASDPTDDQALWVAIRKRCDAINFSNYNHFIEYVFCGADVANLVGNA
ncbi:MAG TPA: hypothetical protein VJ604_15085, partial [Geomonas sp.]|nr:hypothetical protein [Geomonas sp.]